MDPSAGTGASPPQGSLSAAATTLLALLGTRVELLGVELREETLRAQRLLVMGAIGAFLLGAALVLAGILVVVALWDSHRLWAAVAVTVFYGALGAGLLMRLRASVRDAPTPFSATATEIKADLELLRGSPSNS